MALATLTRYSSKGDVKSTLSFKKTHKKLLASSHPLNNSGSSNILLTEVGCDCTIQTASDKLDTFVSFPLRIPGSGPGSSPLFFYDALASPPYYQSKSTLYEAIEHFYCLGRSIANPRNTKHGHTPDYSGENPRQDQYVRHTEQFLVAYLALPEAAEGLLRRLVTEVRANHPLATSIKLHNLSLSLASTKTCCSPCEYTLLGLMNERDGIIQQDTLLGLLPNLQIACETLQTTLPISLSRNHPLRLFTTVFATENDGDHIKTSPLEKTELGEKELPVPYDIATHDPFSSSHLFRVLVKEPLPHHLQPVSNLSDFSVIVSGSEKTPGSRSTRKKIIAERDCETDKLTENLRTLPF